MWNQRYGEPGFAYGIEANDFIREHEALILDTVPAGGRALCLGAGECRNAVWLAERGLMVTAVDGSDVGLAKGRQLASERGVSERLETVVSDLARFDLGQERWELALSVFCHVPPALRQQLHAGLPRALAKGGVLLLEAYTPRQLKLRTGGPPVGELLVEPDALREELGELTLLRCEELQREIHEGAFHHGMSAVVQLIARRPE
jgi:hypothetical protein